MSKDAISISSFHGWGAKAIHLTLTVPTAAAFFCALQPVPFHMRYTILVLSDELTYATSALPDDVSYATSKPRSAAWLSVAGMFNTFPHLVPLNTCRMRSLELSSIARTFSFFLAVPLFNTCQ